MEWGNGIDKIDKPTHVKVEFKPEQTKEQYNEEILMMLDWLLERRIAWRFIFDLKRAFKRYGSLTGRQDKSLRYIYNDYKGASDSLPKGMEGTYCGMWGEDKE